ncbi:N-acetyltransferase family protein [Mailhella sp.]
MKTFTFRSATAKDLEALVALERAVEASLPNREMFAIDDEDFYVPIVEGAGHILLAFDQFQKLAGVSVIRFPALDDPENLGLEVGLSGKALCRVRHAESIFIRPDCGGMGLASRLLTDNLMYTDGVGRDLCFATIWPLNAPSLKLHLSCGFHIRAFALKYGGKARFVLMRSTKPLSFSENVTYVDAADSVHHTELLERHAVGTGCRLNSSGTLEIAYRRLAGDTAR